MPEAGRDQPKAQYSHTLERLGREFPAGRQPADDAALDNELTAGPGHPGAPSLEKPLHPETAVPRTASPLLAYLYELRSGITQGETKRQLNHTLILPIASLLLFLIYILTGNWFALFVIAAYLAIFVLLGSARTPLDPASPLVRRNTYRNLVERGLLAEALDATDSESLLPRRSLLPLITLNHGTEGRFRDARARIDFLLLHYEQICLARHWASQHSQWYFDVPNPPGSASVPARLAHIAQFGNVSRVLLEVLIEILEGRLGSEEEAGDG